MKAEIFLTIMIIVTANSALLYTLIARPFSRSYNKPNAFSMDKISPVNDIIIPMIWTGVILLNAWDLACLIALP